MIDNKLINNYFLLIFSTLPLTYIIGSAVSLINILLIDLTFLFYLFYKKDFFFEKKPIIYLLALYIYLILNTFLSSEPSMGLIRNIGFLRFIILFAAFNYFFKNEKFYTKVLKYWMYIIFIVLVDVLFESYFGKNILGFSTETYDARIVSFFKDEPIVGGFLNSFFLLIIGFYFNVKNKKNKILVIIIINLFLICILLTGERSNTTKAFFGFFLFLLSVEYFRLRIKLFIVSSIFILASFMIVNSDFLKIRFFSNIKNIAINKDSIYLDLYKSGFQVFQNNKFFGVGNKNYRIETCKKTNQLDANKKNYHCGNHPHQIYLEFLSEHGLFGTFILIFILYKLIFSKIIYTYKKKRNYIQLGALIYLIFVFTPLIPSGSFFASSTLTLFMINLSMFYSIDKNLNIFRFSKL